jgi:hypothetical protein
MLRSGVVKSLIQGGSRSWHRLVVMAALAISCRGGAPNAVLVELNEARLLAADLRVQFNKASDASDRAVMADTDDASIAFAKEAARIKALVTTEGQALGTRLRSLDQSSQLGSLQAFEGHFAEYEKVDRDVLELAVENTNLKAQRLSFGPTRAAADGFRDALDVVARAAPPKDRCRADALVAKAVIAVREIQVLQAPHIAESDETAMTRLEQQMAALSTTARDAVKGVSDLIGAGGRQPIALAVSALDRFDGLSREIVKLSRRNSNVRSLELSLRRQPALTAKCDEDLRALQEALAKEAFPATR